MSVGIAWKSAAKQKQTKCNDLAFFLSPIKFSEEKKYDLFTDDIISVDEIVFSLFYFFH